MNLPRWLTPFGPPCFSRFPLALGLAAFLLIPSFGPAWGETVEPGTTTEMKAQGCVSASGSATGDCLLGCNSDCVLASHMAKAFVDVTNYTAGKKFAETTVYTEFTVSAGGPGSATSLDANIAYDIAWKGGWSVAGAFTGWNDGLSVVTLTLSDRTAGGVVRSVEVHRMNAEGFLGTDLVQVGFGLDEGSTVNSMTARLVRGHEYRLGLKVRCEAKGAINASISLDYFGGEWGVNWNELTVALAPDLNEEIDRLKKRLDALEKHTHTYLTGRGEGHNNTEAITSEAILVDSGVPTPEELGTLPKGRPPAQPLPVRSVFRVDPTHSAGPTATIRYTLPEALPVSIRVYDALGRVVSDLLEADQSGGAHEVRFDAAGLPAGVYYYRIVAGRYSETRKLTLLK